jgi:hypothetical protein
MKKIGIIGNLYKYKRHKTVFELIEITPNKTHRFKCGHWCTDNVFIDLICVKGNQEKLF